MRIWHEQLISKLCQKHLCAMWREGLILYYAIIEDKDGWRNHPARKEFENVPQELWHRINKVRKEMLKRGYTPRQMPKFVLKRRQHLKEWQDLKTQIKILKQKKKTIKNCKCNI